MLVFAAFLSMASLAVDWPVLDKEMRLVYDSVFAPRAVAVPPRNAPGGLMVTGDGILRCFGVQKYGERPIDVTLESRDLGLNWTLRPRQKGEGVFLKCPWADYSLDSYASIPGVTTYGKLRALPLRRRWIFAFYRPSEGQKFCHPALVYSDDDGKTWSPRVDVTNALSVAEMRPPDKSHRWNIGCSEPDLIELKDGSVLMMARTGTDHHAFYRSSDGGLTWEGPWEWPAFWASNTMPFLMRLSDGRILAIWNNTQILPRFDAADYPELRPSEIDGTWEYVFTNRDALHAAISEDEGKTWIGFREIALNDIRNRADYREFAEGEWKGGCDKSVHQEDAIELPGGKIVVIYGQNVASRKLALFDVKWLYEKGRADDLRCGLGNFSTQLYVKSLLGNGRGWSGHCAMNRVPGAAMVREPDTVRDTKRECLQICRIRDERLVDDRQGVVWNFPAAKKGKVSFECRIDGAGVRVSLCDHWINPCDGAIASRAPFSVPLNAGALGGAGKWTTISFAWDLDAATVTVKCDGREKALPLHTDGFSPFGLSYLHLQTLAKDHDPKGAYFRWFKMEGE